MSRQSENDPKAIQAAEYKRPTRANLWVKTEHGDEWLATMDDLDKFRLVSRNEGYSHLIEQLRRVGFDGSGKHSALRYFIERTLVYTADADLTFDDADGEDAKIMDHLRRNFDAWLDDDDDIP